MVPHHVGEQQIVVGGAASRRSEYVAGIALGHDSAVVEQDQAVRQPQGLREIVRHVEERDTGLLAQLEQ